MTTVLRALLAGSLLATALVATPQFAHPAAAAGCVQIREIYYNSPGTDTGTNYSLNGEWIRLKNYCSTGKSLYHWTIRDAASHTYTFGSYTLAGLGTVTVHTGKGINTSTNRYWGLSWYVWNNTGYESARLKNAAGTLMDFCSYTGTSLGYKYC